MASESRRMFFETRAATKRRNAILCYAALLALLRGCTGGVVSLNFSRTS